MKIIGLLAGLGRLPVEFARAAKGMGFSVVVIGLLPEVDSELSTVADQYYATNVGELATILGILKENSVKEVTMLGKVTKELMFSGKVPVIDSRMQKMLLSLPDNRDDTIMLGFVKELASEGIGVLDQTQMIKALMPKPGVLTKRQPTGAELLDIEFGFRMAKEIGRLDIGQTVVIKNQAVMAVEAIEGTDACIRRGGLLGRGEVTVVKTAKPNQDMRFDVPGVGPATLQAMVDAGATALAIEAGKTLLVHKEVVLQMAEENHITIVVK